MGLDTHWSDWVPRVNTGRREGTWGKSCLEFFEISFRVIDQSEASRLSTSKLSAEPECLHGIFGNLVHTRESCAHLVFGEVGFRGVEDINDLCKISAQIHPQSKLRHTNCLRLRSRFVWNLRVRRVAPSSAWLESALVSRYNGGCGMEVGAGVGMKLHRAV